MTQAANTIKTHEELDAIIASKNRAYGPPKEEVDYFINEVFKYDLNLDHKTVRLVLDLITEKALWDMSRMNEEAIAKKENLVRAPGDGYDFTNKDEAKRLCANLRYKSYYSTNEYKHTAILSNDAIKNKVGNIFLHVFEPITKKMYYFKIPHSAYSQYRTINISFNPYTGEPLKTNRANSAPWWDYEVKKENA